MPYQKPHQVSIVGFGRFGHTLYRLLKDDFSIVLFRRSKKPYGAFRFTKRTMFAQTIEEVYRSPVVFFAVPISKFEKIIITHKPYFRNHLLIDVLSVKMYPSLVLKKHLKNSQAQAILTHPLFGPDSSKDGFRGLSIVMNRFLSNVMAYNFWKRYFRTKGLRIIELSPEKHDQHAARSHGITHFIGRFLDEINFGENSIGLLGTRRLHEVKEQTTNDSLRLFYDLYRYNPYAKEVLEQLKKAHVKLFQKIQKSFSRKK